jgi:hypothetical protein
MHVEGAPLSRDGRVHGVHEAPDERVLPVEGTWHFRDAGGYPMVLQGLLCRSACLENLTPRGKAALLALGLSAVCDPVEDRAHHG